MKFLYPEQIFYLYKRIMEKTPGDSGLRDIGLLESAVYRSQSTFGGSDLYPDLFSKVSAMGQVILLNHPFIDGNKRVGYEAMRLMLRLNGFDFKSSANEAYRFVLSVAEGKKSVEEMTEWLRHHTRKRWKK